MKHVALRFDGNSVFRGYLSNAGVHECTVIGEVDFTSMYRRISNISTSCMLRKISSYLYSRGEDFKAIYVLESLKDFSVQVFVLGSDNNGFVIWEDSMKDDYQILPCFLRGRGKTTGDIIWDVRDELYAVHSELLDSLEGT